MEWVGVEGGNGIICTIVHVLHKPAGVCLIIKCVKVLKRPFLYLPDEITHMH